MMIAMCYEGKINAILSKYRAFLFVFACFICEILTEFDRLKQKRSGFLSKKTGKHCEKRLFRRLLQKTLLKRKLGFLIENKSGEKTGKSDSLRLMPRNFLFTPENQNKSH